MRCELKTQSFEERIRGVYVGCEGKVVAHNERIALVIWDNGSATESLMENLVIID